MYSTPPHGKHKMLSSISEVDEEWMNNDIMAMAPTDESALQPDEVALRSRLRRGTTEDLISSLHSLKPNSVADNRSVEVGILNEDFSKQTLKTSIRHLLLDINRVGQQSDARYLASNPESAQLLAAGIGSNRRRSTLNHRVRSNTSSSGGGEVVRDRDVIPELKIRDLRQLNNRFSQHEEPYVLIRRHCVLMSLGPHVRVIVQSRRLMILVRQDEVDPLNQTLLNTLSDTIQDLLKNSKLGVELSESQTPFEVKAYCAVFSMYHSLLNKEYTTLLRRSKSMIACISDHTMLSVKLQEFMHTNRENVADLQSRVTGTRRMISTLLEDEDELLLLNLTVLEQNPALYGMPFEDAAEELYSSFSDIESIIESILFDFRTIENQADMMVRKLTHVEQSINLKLDTSRNELLFATTILSVFATVIAFSGYVAGAFGMNLDNTHQYENSQGAFSTIFSLTMLLNAFGGVLIIALFRYYHILPTHAHLHEGVEEGTYHRTMGRTAAAEAAVREAVRVVVGGKDRRPSVPSVETGTTLNALHFTPV